MKYRITFFPKDTYLLSESYREDFELSDVIEIPSDFKEKDIKEIVIKPLNHV